MDRQGNFAFIKLLCRAVLLLIVTFGTRDSFSKGLQTHAEVLPSGTNVSLLVQTVSPRPQTLIDQSSHIMSTPASTQKVITALAALLELGRDYRFTTAIYSQAPITNQHLQGDLIIKMSGDPTFTRSRLAQMLQQLKNQGINTIDGNIIIDISVFNSHDKASGWSWNNLSACYNTAPAATIIDGNCFYATLTPAPQAGQIATASVSPLYPVTVRSDVITTPKNSDNRYCELDVAFLGRNQYQLSGCIKVNQSKQSFHFAVMDNLSYFNQILRTQLDQLQISVRGSISSNNRPKTIPNLRLLASSQSQPLAVLLKEMLKRSDNLIADTVFRTIGAHHFNMPGTWRNSSDAVKAILRQKAGINLQNSVIMDGSGLSRLNLISARSMIEVLQYIAQHDAQLKMIEMLPIANVDGTLRYRASFNKAPYKEHIVAKTGYLQGNYNLAGFIDTQKGHRLAFVQFIGGYSNSRGPKKAAVMKFESQFYKQLLTNY